MAFFYSALPPLKSVRGKFVWLLTYRCFGSYFIFSCKVCIEKLSGVLFNDEFYVVVDNFKKNNQEQSLSLATSFN